MMIMLDIALMSDIGADCRELMIVADYVAVSIMSLMSLVSQCD